MVVTVSELARGFGHLSQGRSAVREQYATKAEVWGAYIRQWQRAEPLKAQFWDRPVSHGHREWPPTSVCAR